MLKDQFLQLEIVFRRPTLKNHRLLHRPCVLPDFADDFRVFPISPTDIVPPSRFDLDHRLRHQSLPNMLPVTVAVHDFLAEHPIFFVCPDAMVVFHRADVSRYL